MSEFQEFAKIGRLSREMVVTEKVDGTNAQVCIVAANTPTVGVDASMVIARTEAGDIMLAGSRSRYITPAADNHGFAAWVKANAADLFALGPGRHFGEWWGSGVQRGYGLVKGEKRFSLFNVARWHRVGEPPYVSVSADPRQPPKFSTEAPACCHVVPVLYRGTFDTLPIEAAISSLRVSGSVASPGFMKPEGIVIFHTASGALFKKTIEKDDEPKSKAGAA